MLQTIKKKALTSFGILLLILVLPFGLVGGELFTLGETTILVLQGFIMGLGSGFIFCSFLISPEKKESKVTSTPRLNVQENSHT